MGPPTTFKEGGASVQFDTFDGETDKMTALTFIQQFDAAFSGGNFTEVSKIRKAISLLKGNALQWWYSVYQSGKPLLTWVDFKSLFVSEWMSTSFEVDVTMDWSNLNSQDSVNLGEYVKRFWKTLHACNSFCLVPLVEQIETFCCGLPKELRNYCIKNKVQNMTQMVKIAQIGYSVLLKKISGFKDGQITTKNEDNKGKKFGGKFKGKEKEEYKGPNPYRSTEERKELMANN